MLKKELQLKLSHQQQLLNKWKNKHEEESCKREKLQFQLDAEKESLRTATRKLLDLAEIERTQKKIIKNLSKALFLSYREVN